jgi:cytidine deaminase
MINGRILKKNPPEDLLAKSRAVLELAYAPYSHFAVGACLRSADGRLFSGANIENASYALTLCAETNALVEMLKNGQRRWLELLIVSSGKDLCFPCGACRQRLFEFADPQSVCHLWSNTGDYQFVSLKDLFPFPFGPHNLESV